MKLLSVNGLAKSTDGLPKPLLRAPPNTSQVTALCDTVFLVPVQLITSPAVAPKASHGVLAGVLTSSIVEAAFVYVSTMSKSVESVALVANTLEAAR